MEISTDEPVPFDDELDENGLPIASFSGDDESEDGVSDGGDGRAGPSTINRAEKPSDFAAEFYRSGTDWSCLAEETGEKGGRRSLVQRDLFQMWGIKKSPKVPAPEVMSPPQKRRRRSSMVTIGETNKAGNNGTDYRPFVCPFYKKIPGTPFTVDAFRYGQIEGCSTYFLTHFHHDHYGGLSKRWSHGPIYCTPLTSRLVRMCLSVEPLYICPLELGKEYIIDGIKVTMLEANHCPGAALILFCLKDGQRVLHTGDFRASKYMQSYPLLIGKNINVLYLDTTYCHPKYRFPPKEEVVDFVVRITQKYLKKQPKTLIVVGAYSIGKEQVFLSISQALGVPIYTNSSRRRILQTFDWPELSGKLCSCGNSSPLHVLPLSFLRPENLKEYLETYAQYFTAVLAFRPTGWTYSEVTGNQLDLIKPISKGSVTIYGVPYSEHSSFTELREFVKFLNPGKVIPTVNVRNAVNREKMQSYFREWLKA